ncbi:hypothetical protein MPRG_21160 [Mycobacterium paragordonae]|uniref:Uncharacterized protein n=1 Tax=Mycobacterium paragordonae TaxID=1389713 RepID=A0ABQ1C356_9MYCO|nr:hypothetical protein MPRG_21160 [Mycobacterium paragordonae]
MREGEWSLIASASRRDSEFQFPMLTVDFGFRSTGSKRGDEASPLGEAYLLSNVRVVTNGMVRR